jgi:hypothetical protein
MRQLIDALEAFARCDWEVPNGERFALLRAVAVAAGAVSSSVVERLVAALEREGMRLSSEQIATLEADCARGFLARMVDDGV